MKIIEKEVICAACHHSVNILVVMSYSSLKTSIDGNQHHDMQYQAVQVCPICGHVSLDIAAPVAMVSSKTFHGPDKQLNDILKGADTYALNGRDELASYMYRLASWKAAKLDDLSLKRQCKEQSIHYLEKYLTHLPTLKDEHLSYFVVLIDCYRQVEAFDKARELCFEVMENLSSFKNQHLIDCISKEVQMELAWIEKKDVDEHDHLEG